jgi:hypothetical protein
MFSPNLNTTKTANSVPVLSRINDCTTTTITTTTTTTTPAMVIIHIDYNKFSLVLTQVQSNVTETSK